MMHIEGYDQEYYTKSTYNTAGNPTKRDYFDEEGNVSFVIIIFVLGFYCITIRVPFGYFSKNHQTQPLPQVRKQSFRTACKTKHPRDEA